LKTILLGCSAAFVVFSAQGQTAKKPTPMKVASLAEQAAQLAEGGQCEKALPVLKRAAAINAEKELKRRVGFAGVRCAMTLNQPNQALDFLRMLDREFPLDPEVLYLSVHTYSDLSLRASQKLMKVAPSSYPARQLAAESFEVQGRWDDAEKEYRRILEENPQVSGIHYRLGRIILSKPETPSTAEDAKKEFEAELTINPNNAGAEYVLGELARQGEQFPIAIEHFTRAARLDAGFADAFLGLGIALISEKRYSDAIPPLETAVKLQPGNPTGHYDLSIAYARAGRQEDAKREAALHKATLEKIELDKQKAADAVQGQSSGQDKEKAGPPQ
jgi:tetratricopeptide (TPR) repeat protein